MRRVRTLDALNRLALTSKSVTGLPWGKPTPAAVVMSMQARRVLDYLRVGLFVYTPKKKNL